MSSVIHGQLDFEFNDEFKNLNYINEPFNNSTDMQRWRNEGFNHERYTGDLCDMRRPQPTWNAQVVDYFAENFSWCDIGTAYYRMGTGVILPTHQDTYKRYVELFDLQGKEHTIYRAVVFLEDWNSGHYGEYDGCAHVNWQRGDFVVWNYDLPHCAANLGTTPRYTLQVTGHVE